MTHSIERLISRRRALCQAGAAVGVAQRIAASELPKVPKSVIYIFLSGGMAQQDTLDPKPEAPSEIRGEFSSIATRTPGLQICEHLPRLAERSNRWSLIRSLTHPYNEHSQGHMVMLSGRTDLPKGFSPLAPGPMDHPSIATLVGSLLPESSGLPSSIVLPERLIHRTGRVIPGQLAGVMGQSRDPWMLTCSRFNATSYGAWPSFCFHHLRGPADSSDQEFQTPELSLNSGRNSEQVDERRALLSRLDRTPALSQHAEFARCRIRALEMLGNGRLDNLFDIQNAPSKIRKRYGDNSFGWSLMLANRLTESGVNFVQVNLGNNETWDTHGNAFPSLKKYLLPPMDRSVSALLDDLYESGRLDSTLVVMAGEFGRTPKVFGLSQYALPGRDHWGAVQTVLLAGCGFGDGKVIGSSDNQGGHPSDRPVKPEELAATMFNALGIPKSAIWYDLQSRPHPVYNAGSVWS